jgi:hypothetical protein
MNGDGATELLRRLEKARVERLAATSGTKSVTPHAAVTPAASGEAPDAPSLPSPKKSDSTDILQQSLRLVQRVTDMGLGSPKPPTPALPKGFMMVPKPHVEKAATSVAEESYK